MTGFKTLFHFERLKASKIICDRLDNYNKNTLRKKKKLRENSDISKKALVSAKRTKKSLHLVNFMNKQFKIFLILTKKMKFVTRNKRNIDNKTFYWLNKYKKQQIFKQKIISPI